MPKKKQTEQNNEIKEPQKNGSGEYIELPLDEISVSEFLIQMKRRGRFSDGDLAQLAESIKNQGLINPITVRPRNWQVKPQDGKGNYNLYNPDLNGGTTSYCVGMSKEKVEAEAKQRSHEIVAGERRFLAAKLAGLKSIPVFIKDLSDEAALEVQMQENLQRVDVDPLDEAFSYHYLANEKKYSVEELMIRFGKNEKFIRGRLKLNDLIPAGIEAIEKDELPLGHAMEIAKYPADAQKEILEKKYAYKYQDKDYGLIPFAKFKETIKERISLKLADAPFDTNDSRLRPDGLICPDCPQRTGYAPVLFHEDFKSEDACLNRSCFELKTFAHLTIQRATVAEKLPNPEKLSADDLIKSVPFVSDSWLGSGSLKQFPDSVSYQRQEFYDEKECGWAIESVVIDGKRKGQTVFICISPECNIHGESDGEKDTGPSEWQLRRAETEFNVNVANQVRERIFAEAMKTFDDDRIALWHYDDLIRQLILKLWEYSYSTKDLILKIIQTWENFPKKPKDEKEFQKFINSLNSAKQSQLLFLLIVSREGHSDYHEVSQDGVKKIMSEWTALDYAKLDAEARVQLAPDEFKPLVEEYKAKIEAGEEAEIPKFYLTAEALEKFEAENDDDDDDDDLELEDSDLDDEEIDENDLDETSQG